MVKVCSNASKLYKNATLNTVHMAQKDQISILHKSIITLDNILIRVMNKQLE